MQENKVKIPASSFISMCNDSDKLGTLEWLECYVGSVNSGKWNAGLYVTDTDDAIFWFADVEDAISFKLRWL